METVVRKFMKVHYNETVGDVADLNETWQAFLLSGKEIISPL